jgi:hypothetical protein
MMNLDDLVFPELLMGAAILLVVLWVWALVRIFLEEVLW